MSWFVIASSITVLFIYTTLFLIGCWEADLAFDNEPTIHSSPGFINGYFYTVFASITNIVSSFVLTLMLYFRNDKITISYLICIISIWGLVLFVGMINDDIRTGPFQYVVVAQLIITIIGCFLCTCSCLGFMIANSCIEDNIPKDYEII